MPRISSELSITAVEDFRSKREELIAELVRRRGEPVGWAGNCAVLAAELAQLVGGVAIRGHWVGPISAQSSFGNHARAGFAGHSWVLTPQGLLLDPTSWAFGVPRNCPPPNEVQLAHRSKLRSMWDNYDPAGQRLRWLVALRQLEAGTYTNAHIPIELGMHERPARWFQQTIHKFAPGMSTVTDKGTLKTTVDLLRLGLQLPLIDLGPEAWDFLEELRYACQAHPTITACVPIDYRNLLIDAPHWVRARLHEVVQESVDEAEWTRVYPSLERSSTL